ncbi:hypothetical protein [Rhizobium laguerreae]|uniref:hypothetical protein n=1 Tax=Rhizobium laguerreae TaxID=1076926 RepID=UPI001C904897|nr:hypothetical protein [Rhizobium laguerreae]MBY3342871.1 hypothetical protein [Rhizobium laguerreae]MBY3349906.1 hypothetical protein [Rhizobium laguerreae]MBY3371009.1 hypothetical protein [Rhizobium laguerreae]MBY3426249.1 hypothetical protein [Rhizobium laguerreae]MBY3434199.1 hypothetical protein [Rhizobium laguerreae]
MVNSLDDSAFEGFTPGYFDNFLDDRDYLHTLVHNIDWQSQLLAVRLMISRNRQAGEAFSKAIEDERAKVKAYNGPHHDHYVDHHVDMVRESIYRDAAESMAAIGMIAPLVESTLGQSLAALGDMYDRKNIHPGNHKRWKRAESHAERWNCQFYFDDKNLAKNNIILGLPQLAAGCGLDKFLSQDFMTWFEAMFIYRNFMFHGGFEWTIERREIFEEKIEENGWELFFTCSTLNGRPWVYYIKDEAIVALPTMVESMLDSLGLFAKALPSELKSEP